MDWSDVRRQFAVPVDTTYLVGHSLGLQPRRASELMQAEMDKWAEMGVAGHFSGERPWVELADPLSESMARLVGAQPDEVVAMNTLTVNLHLLMESFYRPTPERHKILIEDHAFPSDHYAVSSQIRSRGLDPTESMSIVGPRPGEDTLRTADIVAAINQAGDELALVLLPGIQYYTGQVLSMEEIVAAGHRVGAKVGFDLAHAAGNVEMDLHDWGVDFAAWCTYKYMNAGPGAVAGAFIHRRHHHAGLPRLEGWWGHHLQTRFEMDNQFAPAPGAAAWAVSNPPILSMVPLVASLELFEEVGMAAIRERSLHLSRLADELLNDRLGDRVRMITPESGAERGAMLSLEVVAGAGQDTYRSLQNGRVACDWRYPNVIRVAPAPLYNTTQDVERFVDVLASAVL